MFVPQMAQPNTVKTVEVSKVGPPPISRDSSISPNSLPLTFFDLMWLRFQPYQMLFFYQLPVSKTLFFDSILPKLKHSLSLTLHHFLPLAGNLTWPETSHKPFLTFTEGDGLSFTVAESDADFYHLSGTQFCEANACHPLIPQLAISPERASVLALQVTLFPDHGFSIAFAFHHAVLDGETSSTFIKTWAQICKHGDHYVPSSLLPPKLKPLYDRSLVKDPKGLEAIYLEQWLNADGPNNRSLETNQLQLKVESDSVRGTFDLSRADIEKLTQFAKFEMAKKDEKADHISTFSVACAYAWACLIKVEGISRDIVFLSMSVDCRSRVVPCVPAYWGNCIANMVAVAEAKGVLGEEGFVVAVKAIGKAIKSLENNGVLEGAENWVRGMSSLPPFRVYSIAWSPRFEVYSSDFGWARPRKVDFASTDRTGAISIVDSRDGDGGVEVGLVLKKHYMDAFASLFAKGLQHLPV